MNEKAHLMRHHPEMLLAKQTYIKWAQLKNHPTLNTLSLLKLPPNLEQANGSVT